MDTVSCSKNDNKNKNDIFLLLFKEKQDLFVKKRITCSSLREGEAIIMP